MCINNGNNSRSTDEDSKNCPGFQRIIINGLTMLFLGLNKQLSLITAAGLHPAFRCRYDQRSNTVKIPSYSKEMLLLYSLSHS